MSSSISNSSKRRRLALLAVLLCLINVAFPYTLYYVLLNYIDVYLPDVISMIVGVAICNFFNSIALYCLIVERNKVTTLIFGSIGLVFLVVLVGVFLYGLYIASTSHVEMKTNVLSERNIGFFKKIYILKFDVPSTRTVSLTLINPTDYFVKVKLVVYDVSCGKIPRDFISYYLSRDELWLFPKSENTVNLTVTLHVHDNVECEAEIGILKIS